MATSQLLSGGTAVDAGPTKGIAIAGWSITAVKLPILNAPESDAASASLHLPLPEICFGNNRLKVQNERLGLLFEWDTLRALHKVDAESSVKVAHADEWARGQAASGSSDVAVQKPYDWTYTTLQPGSFSYTSSSQASTSSAPSFTEVPPSHPGIPLHLLARQDIPILFFDEVPLFEDELGDNGIAELVVRVRVNATSVFVLSRFFLRVDHVLFRIFDVRLYHAFGSTEIIRETKGRQASYDSVKRRLPADAPNDLTPLTDVNWVSSILESLATSPSPRSRVPPSWPSAPQTTRDPPVSLAGLDLLEGGKRVLPRWEGEGRVLEVMEVESVTG